jgi:hypothetical protein
LKEQIFDASKQKAMSLVLRGAFVCCIISIYTSFSPNTSYTFRYKCTPVVAFTTKHTYKHTHANKDIVRISTKPPQKQVKTYIFMRPEGTCSGLIIVTVQVIFPPIPYPNSLLWLLRRRQRRRRISGCCWIRWMICRGCCSSMIVIVL